MNDEHIIQLYFARDEDAIQATQDKYGPYCSATTSWGTPGRRRSASTTPGSTAGTPSRPSAPCP